MSRNERLAIAGFSHYVMHRGHGDEPVFESDTDYLNYLCDMNELKSRYNVQVQGWCLLKNQVHLLLNPMQEAQSLSDFMQNLAARHTRAFNTRHGRRGTRWEGRYRSTLVEPGQWRLNCIRYLELLPVQMQITRSAKDHRWSSYRPRVGLSRKEGLLDPDPDYKSLADTEAERRDWYRQFLGMGCDYREREKIEKAVRRCQLTGGSLFVDRVEDLTGRRVVNRGPGRPRKASASAR